MMWFKHRARLLALSFALAGSGLMLTRPAAADAGSCVNLHASGQRGIKSGTLRQAVKDFMACGSDEACPAAVRTECTELYSSTERLLPTVIFSVVDERGSDVAAVKVYSGQELLAESLDGRALPIDPGKHQLRFELPWGESISQDLLIREGEKNRVIPLKVHDPQHPAVASAAGAPDGAPVPPDSTSAVARPKRLPIGFWIAAGVGVAAVGTGAVFELRGRSQHSDLADCSPRCPDSRRDDYDSMKKSYLIGDIALGAGVAALGVATVVYFTSRGKEEAPTGAVRRGWQRLAIVPTFSTRGATLHVTGVTF